MALNLGGYGDFFQSGHIDLTVKMACITEDGIVFHFLEMSFHDDIFASGHRHKEVSQFGCLVHLHDPETFHGCVQSFKGVDLRNDYIGSHALSTHGNSFAAPAIAGYHHCLAGHDQVCGIHDGGPHGLAGSVFIIIVMFCFRVINCHHRTGKNPFSLPGFQTDNAGGGLLTATDQVICILCASSPQEVNQVTAVIYDEVGMALKGFCQKVFIFLSVHSIFTKGFHSHLGHSRRHIILGRQGVTSREEYFSPTLFQHQSKVGGLGLQMYGNGDSQPFKRLFLLKLFLDLSQGRHVGPNPLNLSHSGRRQGSIFYNTHSNSPLCVWIVSGGQTPLRNN